MAAAASRHRDRSQGLDHESGDSGQPVPDDTKGCLVEGGWQRKPAPEELQPEAREYLVTDLEAGSPRLLAPKKLEEANGNHAWERMKSWALHNFISWPQPKTLRPRRRRDHEQGRDALQTRKNSPRAPRRQVARHRQGWHEPKMLTGRQVGKSWNWLEAWWGLWNVPQHL